MSKINPFKYYKTSPEIIKLAIMYYVRYPLSLRNVEDILYERGIDICHETIRYWWNKLGPIIAKDLKKKKTSPPSKWRWHIDEVFVKINGELHYLWRAIDHEGTVLDCVVTKRRNKRAALKVLKKLISRHGKPKEIVTDKLASYGAALRELDMKHLQNTDQYQNNQAENSHLHFRRREKIMNKFRSMGSLQKFTAIQSQFQNHFNHERHIETRSTFKNLRQSSLNAWHESLAA
jgi:putative transposase